MHDRYSNNRPAYTGPNIMAITYETTYTRGRNGVVWNTPQDYRENGQEMALAILDYFSLPVVPATLTRFEAH